MFDVISLGTATYDVFLKSPGMEINQKGEDENICFRYGAKLEVNEIFFDYGGGGTNSAVTFARQGLKIASIVQVGDDFFGKKILADLQEEGVATNLVNIQEGNTDYSTILWVPNGGRTILVYRGKTRLEIDNVLWDKLDSKWFYISSLEGNLQIIENLIRRFGGENCRIAWNPGSRELKQKEKLLSLLPSITLLNVNKEEMIELLAISNKQLAISDILSEAQKLPCEYIVITDDKRGAYFWNKRESYWYNCGIFEDSPGVETTGAGDAFGSGLVTGFMKGYPFKECLYLASANASSVVGKMGAKKGILRPEDLSAWGREKLLIKRL